LWTLVSGTGQATQRMLDFIIEKESWRLELEIRARRVVITNKCGLVGAMDDGKHCHLWGKRELGSASALSFVGRKEEGNAILHLFNRTSILFSSLIDCKMLGRVLILDDQFPSVCVSIEMRSRDRSCLREAPIPEQRAKWQSPSGEQSCQRRIWCGGGRGSLAKTRRWPKKTE
jgi:hypothetical protein